MFVKGPAEARLQVQDILAVFMDQLVGFGWFIFCSLHNRIVVSLTPSPFPFLIVYNVNICSILWYESIN